MGISVRHSIGDLARDLAEIPPKAAVEMQDIVRDGARAGNQLAKDFARASSGVAARYYPGYFTTQTNTRKPTLFGGFLFSSEYGPRAEGQGELASVLEEGSRNNPAHQNLTRSQDIIGPSFAQEVRQMIDRLFW